MLAAVKLHGALCKTQFHLLSLFFITNSIFAHTRSFMQSIQHFSFVIYSPLFWSLIFSVANSGSNERAFWLFYRGRDGDQSTTVDMVKRSTLSRPLRHTSGGSCMRSQSSMFNDNNTQEMSML